MGDAEGKPDETPHQVTLSRSFYIGTYEITNAQWRRVMLTVPSRWQEDNHPVENVTWEKVVEFCHRLSSLPEEQAAGRTYRLPTEAEWEYACRAGATTRYCFGDADTLLGEYAWFAGTSAEQSHPVGGKKPNAWGLYDVHGNVWEYCGDWFDPHFYTRSTKTDPQGPTEPGPFHVIRGGSWRSDQHDSRAADRHNFAWGYTDHIGARLVLEQRSSTQ
jgi:formylglycine-generating enzyme required for sulfatase activity